MADLLSYALTSVADVKESLGIDSGDNSKNNLIIRKINQATEMIERFTGRRFTQTTYTQEEYDATNIDQLILKNRPVITFALFEARDSSLNEDDWSTVDSELYFVDDNAGVIDLMFNAVGRWNRYRATYIAGYAAIPADIAEAAATLASFLVENPTSGAAVRRKREGQREIEYFDAKSNSSSLFEQLGIDETLRSYANDPILADK